jgi:ATP phosphoribosyltransferase regulatory subunit
VAASAEAGLGAALARMAELHGRGESAELCPEPCASSADAEAIAAQRGCRGAQWLAA